MSSSILDRKIDYWEHQLLDLGKRNKMINYRETKRATLKITEPSLSDLFHRLAVKEEKLTFQRAIDKETDIRVFSILSLLESLSSPLPVTVGDIGTESSVMERQKTLKHLRSKSRLALEEQGTNILYLSFGFIEWKDGKGASAKWIKSPLVLVPVVLSLESLNSPYTLEKHEDDIVVNPTLDYYLNTEYGIDLPEFDENKESIDEFLIKMEEIADMRGWRILPEVSLGLLSFLKITMYNDLLVNEERIRKHPVIRAIAGEAEEVNQIPEELIDFDLDSIGVQDCFQVMSADSSQQDAILYSKNNVSFVMQGPPGTGKSQTITNIIAEALADGKKVLFVSEKMAALQVVYRRLHEAHLGEFCLPLHSYKANKKEILEQIGANLKLKQTRVKDTARNSLDNLQSIRDEINAYAKELHQVIEPLNMSCYEVYGKLDEVGASPSISFALDKTASLSQTNLNHLLGLLKKYSLAVSGLNYYIKNNPWDGIRICSIGYDEKQKMALCLSDAINFLAHCTEQLDSIKECEHMASALTYKQLPDFCHDLLTVTSLPKIPSEWLRYENTDVISTKAITASDRYKNMKELREQISVVFNEAIFSFDYNGWKISVTDMLALIENIGFLGHNDYNFVYENAEILSSQVKAFFDEVTVFENNISKAESLLGTQLSRNTTCFGFLNSLLLLTKDNSFLPKEWVLGDVTKLKQTTVSAKTLSAEIKAIGQCINQITQYYEQVKLFSYSFIDPTKVSESLFVDIDSEHLIFDSINAVCTEIPTIPEPFAYLKSVRKQTDVVFYNTIFSLDYIGWVNNAFDYFSQIEGVGLLNPANRDIIFENAQRFIVQVRLLSDEVSAFEKNLSEIDTLLETKLSRDLAGIDFSRELYASIKDNTPLPNEWLSGDIVKVKATAFDARTLASEIISIEHDILQSWEKDILTFDYLPILQRFKTDYTSILKVFNHQYRADKKSIQVLSVNVIKKLTDESALEILNQLKDYHEKLNLFNENSSEYSNVLGERFSGINSDWDGIFRIIATCINVQNLFNGKVPHKIANNLSGDHNTLIEKILSLTKTSESALRNARSIVERNQFNFNFNAADIDTMNVIANADKIIVLLDKLSAQKEVIQGYLKDKETDYETIVQSIKSLEECNRLLSVIKNEEQKFIKIQSEHYFEKLGLFNENSDEYARVLGCHFNGIESDWGEILRITDICTSIQEQFNGHVPEKTATALSHDHQEFNASLSSFRSNAASALTNAKRITAENRFNADLESQDIQTIEILSTSENTLNWLNHISKQKSDIKSCINRSKTNYTAITQTIEQINEYNTAVTVINETKQEYTQLFDFLFKHEDTDWADIISRDKQYRGIWTLPFVSYIRPLINASDIRRSEIAEAADSVQLFLRKQGKSVEWLNGYFTEERNILSLNVLSLLQKLNGCQDNLHLFEKWIDYQEAKIDCNKIGLENYISAVEAAGTFDSIESSFLKGFYQMWLGEAYNNLPAVRRFRRNVQDNRITEFVKLDDYQLKVAQMRIREKLIENLPSTNHLLKATDEVSILKKELGKKRRIMPLRKLFRQIPNLLLKLKPCLMMSPLSVSYFLETEAYNFDMVIFDEASQIFPEDAIGAIFRGAQVIIAGDSKQLPPTNFFASTTNNLDSDYDINDDDADFAESISDSILEETASALPNRTLLWHYRSKHESLISFSNSEIYKNTLITFPNSTDVIADMGVEYIYVPDGYYEGGGKNCNVLEARKCVELVVEHIRNHPERSLGIIAFSEKQQNAIENAIIEFRESNPEYESFFDEAAEEPFFVKNLENVQGDERDTIIFSICYAKDRNGRMFMRFGPLGHDGGERRLNVAITRAKCNVKLVGSILPSDIDLNRTKSEGVRMLRSYIEFARSDFASAHSEEQIDEFIASDEFCDEVAAFLVEKGYKIQRRIGCSDYKIDIAVENPKLEGDYIAGIECDGLSYMQAKTARDRDHLRRKVLENMGWNMYRVWSTEWSKYPQQEKEALVSFLESLTEENGQTKHALITSSNTDESSIDEIADEQTRKETAPSANPYGFAYYEESKWWETEYSNRLDNDTRIADNILHIVREEQPIHIELLYKRLGNSFTAGKATSAVKNTINFIIDKKLKGRVQVDENQFVRMLPLERIVVRIPKPYYTPRPMEYIHDEEVALAMVEIVRHSYGLSPKDLAAECARVFGFERRGKKIKAKTQAAFSLLIDKGYAKIVDGKVYLTGGN